MAATSCPTPHELSQFEQGRLDESDTRRIREHVASCRACGASWPTARFAAVTQSSAADGAGSPPATEIDPRHFPQIDGYRITGVLGHGGMGIVYRAVQTKLNRAVALKVLPAVIGSASPSAVARFRREATAAARLHHTNIVPVYDFGESGDACYYAMELIHGQSLEVVLRHFARANVATVPPARLAEVIRESTTGASPGPVSRELQAPCEEPSAVDVSATMTGRGHPYYHQVARWFADLAEALHAAHGEGIIHRDIKPANLILSVDGRILVADFGLAKSVEEESVTMTGSLMGTVRYLSPEQAMAKRVAVDHRTDLYSLGATMYELLCFRPAFPGDDHKEILASIIARDPVAPRKILQAVPRELETICLKTLEKSPDARYATGRAMADDLRRYIHDLPLVAKRPGWIARTRKFVRRHRAGVLASAALMLLIATIPVVIHLRMRGNVESRKRMEAESAANAAELVALGHLLENNQKWTEAAERYEEALALDPDNVNALGNLARMKKERYNHEGRKDPALLRESLDYCERALEINPRQAASWNLKGGLLKMLGRYDEAILAYEEAIALTEDYWPAWENLGVLHALVGNLDAAETKIAYAAELTTESPFPCASVWRNLAALQLHQRSSEAFASLERAFDCKAVDSANLRLRARLYLESEQYRDVRMAIKDADYAGLLAQRQDPKAARVLARAYLENEQFDEALASAQAAIALGDELSTFNHLIVAIALAKRRDLERARAAHRQALDEWPPGLKNSGEYLATAEHGILWFESADELFRLDNELAGLLADAAARP